MDINSLLALLADGQVHSGAELGRQLGVSRTAVWKSLDRMVEYGLVFERVKGKGYKLAEALDLLCEDEIRGGLECAYPLRTKLELRPVVESTNTLLAVRSGMGVGCYEVLLAEMQTEGRGRRGRTWVSPFGKNIYMSLGFELSGGPESLAGLSLVAGLSVARAITQVTGLSPGLKWPNDVWLDGKKVAGILVELQGEATTGWRVILGVGLNVMMGLSDGEEIDQPWSSLGPYMNCSRSKLAENLALCLIEDIEQFKVKGFGHFLPAWSAVDVFLGRRVDVLGAGISGVAEGVDPMGNLMVRDGDSLHVIRAGEVSVRANEA